MPAVPKSYGQHVIAGALLVSLAGPLAAQRLPPRRFDTALHPQRIASFQTRSAVADSPTVSLKAPETPTGTLILGAVLGGALAGAAGAGLGYATGDDPNSDGLGAAFGAVAGFALLEPIGLGIGTHVANRGRGSAPLDVLASAGTLVLMVISGRAQAYAAIPAQVAVAIAVERATSHRGGP